VHAVAGDVMGHGPDEAALGVHLRVAWRTLLLAGTPDDQILPTLGQLLDAEQDVRRRYVTACYLTFDGPEATVRIAGHPAPIVCAAGRSEYADLAVGPPLGIAVPQGHGGWPDNRLPTPPGTSVLLYTDGLLDAYTVDPTSDTLGIDELAEALRGCLTDGGPVRSWIAKLVGNAPRDSVDDTAVVVLTVEAQ
jgi:serine phosphatase RsbU (regulator of sigma subunit)